MGGQFLFTVVLLFIAQHAHAGKFGPGGPGGFGGMMGGFGGIGGAKQLRFQIIVAQTQAKTAVETATTTITNNVAAGEAAIDAELAASQAKAAATGSAPCVQKHSATLAQVNSKDVGTNCGQELQLLNLENQVSLMSGLHTELSAVYTLCPFWPPASQATCVENFTSEFGLKIDASLAGVVDGATAVTTNSATCVTAAGQNAHNIIAQANQALDQCVAN